MPFAQTLTNQTQTNNGALAYKSTNSAVLDLFSSGISSRNKRTLIQAALKEDEILTLKVCLYLRDVRNGQGNRDILRALFKELATTNSYKYMKRIIKHIPEIGRWKDVIEQIGLHSKLDKKILKLIKKHLDLEDGLLAKWLPRQGEVAKLIADYLDLDHGVYRRKIVSLSKTIEQQMCSKEWSAIEYSHVPSVANKKYANAFLRNDTERRQAFLDKTLSGNVKMNSSVLYPHQITSMVRTSDNDTANALWKNLPNYMENSVNVLPIIDTSGSMFSKAVGTEGTCLDIAIGLGLYFAEHNTGSYKNLWMNFSTDPKAYYLKGNTLSERIANLDYRNWGEFTDINKTFEFILHAAKENPQDLPKMILIVSDMEFNYCGGYTTNYELAKKQFAAEGLELPTIVFWRVNVSSGSTPVTKNKNGTVLINGYSSTVLKEILSGDISNYNPYSTMLKIVQSKYTFLDEE